MVISGTGRSGTKYIHSVLTSLGLDMGIHEKSRGKDGFVGGYRVLSNSGSIRPNKLILQIRNPIKTIASSLGSKNLIDYPEFGLTRRSNDELTYIIKCYYHMNLWIHKKSVFSYTLEDLNELRVTDKLIRLFNLECSEKEFNRALKDNLTGEKMNVRTKRSLPILNVEQGHYMDSCLKLYNSIKL